MLWGPRTERSRKAAVAFPRSFAFGIFVRSALQSNVSNVPVAPRMRIVNLHWMGIFEHDCTVAAHIARQRIKPVNERAAGVGERTQHLWARPRTVRE